RFRHKENATTSVSPILCGFNIGSFHSNCGAVIINRIHKPLYNRTYMKHIIELSFEIARKFGYSIAMYSHHNKEKLDIFKYMGMKGIYKFKNKRTGNKLEILTIKL
ncbi:MAG: hypothetical protein AABY22_20085, partial [Nanoarchaeota archaeon]